jgi:hypothetical protein
MFLAELSFQQLVYIADKTAVALQTSSFISITGERHWLWIYRDLDDGTRHCSWVPAATMNLTERWTAENWKEDTTVSRFQHKSHRGKNTPFLRHCASLDAPLQKKPTQELAYNYWKMTSLRFLNWFLVLMCFHPHLGPPLRVALKIPWTWNRLLDSMAPWANLSVWLSSDFISREPLGPSGFGQRIPQQIMFLLNYGWTLRKCFKHIHQLSIVKDQLLAGPSLGLALQRWLFSFRLVSVNVPFADFGYTDGIPELFRFEAWNGTDCSGPSELNIGGSAGRFLTSLFRMSAATGHAFSIPVCLCSPIKYGWHYRRSFYALWSSCSSSSLVHLEKVGPFTFNSSAQKILISIRTFFVGVKDT